MSLKGKIFPDNPAQTERWRIVARDPDTGEDIVAEELQQCILNRLSAPAKRVAGQMMTYPAEVRQEVLKAFKADGTLKNPFQKA